MGRAVVKVLRVLRLLPEKGGSKGRAPLSPEEIAVREAEKEKRQVKVAEDFRRDEEMLATKKAQIKEIDGDDQLAATGKTREQLVLERAAIEASAHKCCLCGFSFPVEELDRHMVGHESPILEDVNDGKAVPWLLLGRSMNIDPHTMHRRGITHIVNVSCSFHESESESVLFTTRFFREQLEEKRQELGDPTYNFTVRSFNWEDTAEYVEDNLLPNVDRDPCDLKYSACHSIEEATKYIHAVHRQSSMYRVLVHCSMGISRSSATIIAYLVEYQNMTLRQAWKHTLDRRFIIRPNRSFLLVLGALEKKRRSTQQGPPTLTECDVAAREEANVPEGENLIRVRGNFDDYEEVKKRKVEQAC